MVHKVPKNFKISDFDVFHSALAAKHAGVYQLQTKIAVIFQTNNAHMWICRYQKSKTICPGITESPYKILSHWKHF